MSKSPSEILNNVSEKEVNRILEAITEEEIVEEIKNQASKMSEAQIANEVKKAGSEDDFIENLTKIAIRAIVTKKILIGSGIALTVAASAAQAAVDSALSTGSEIAGAAAEEAGGGFLDAVADFFFG